MSNNNKQAESGNGSNQGGKIKEGFGIQDTKQRDFERINTGASSVIKKGNDPQPLTSKGKGGQQ